LKENCIKSKIRMIKPIRMRWATHVAHACVEGNIGHIELLWESQEEKHNKEKA
jgi:hypothetical protein